MGSESLDPKHAASQLALAALDGLREHVCVLDEAGNILYVNRAWRQFSQDHGGQPALTGEGANYIDVCLAARGDDEDSAQSFREQLQHVLRGDIDGFEQEYPCHGPNDLKWFVARASRVDGSGPARVVVVHQAITELRIDAAKARQAQRLQAMGRLAGGLAHDFNNVLGAILGNAVIALAALEPEHPATEAVQRIQRSGQRARELIRRILAVSRGELMPPTVQPLRPLLNEALSMLRLSAPQGSRLETRLSRQPLWARVDATDLEQAVMNLVQNAFHAIADGEGACVTVGLEAAGVPDAARPDQPGLAHLWVQDDGCGMSKALQQRIFESFFTTRALGEGTGLGLVQVLEAAQRAQMRVEVESAPGQGSTFHLWIPLCEPPGSGEPSREVGPAERLEPLPVPAPVRPSRRRGKADIAARWRVLLVDDDEVIRLTLSALLRESGMHVESAGSAPEALGVLNRAGAPIDILVTDQTMPEMSGLDLCRQARSLRPSMPLILVSGSLDSALLEQLRTLQPSTAVCKEESAQALVPAIAMLLESASVDRHTLLDG